MAPDFLSRLLSYWNILLMVCVWTGIQTVRRILPPELHGEGSVIARLMPLAPILICLGAVWVPGPWIEEGMTGGQRVVLGTVLGALTSNLHAISSKLGFAGLVPLIGEPDRSKKRKKPL